MEEPEAPFSIKTDWITVKYSQIEQLYNEGSNIYNDKVKLCIASAKLLELIALNPYFDKMTALLKQYSDLVGLSEDTIFIQYETGI